MWVDLRSPSCAVPAALSKQGSWFSIEPRDPADMARGLRPHLRPLVVPQDCQDWQRTAGTHEILLIADLVHATYQAVELTSDTWAGGRSTSTRRLAHSGVAHE